MTTRNALTCAASSLVLAAAIGLAACQPKTQQAPASSAPAPLSAIPLTTASAPPSAPAPVADALPPAPPAPVGRLADQGDAYAFADNAYAMQQAFGDAPPDYTFDDGDGERPWVWQGDDQAMQVAEPLPGGGYRYFYYEPGADAPYLVRDADYSYGYDHGVLVVVYDRHGRALQPAGAAARAAIAGRYLARGEAMAQASRRQQREAVGGPDWTAHRDQIDAERAQWKQDRAADQDWDAYHAQHQQQEEADWDAERYRREAEAARFAQSMNDAQRAAQDWQAARQAQTAMAARPSGAQPQTHGGPLASGPRPTPTPPSGGPMPPSPQPLGSSEPGPPAPFHPSNVPPGQGQGAHERRLPPGPAGPEVHAPATGGPAPRGPLTGGPSPHNPIVAGPAAHRPASPPPGSTAPVHTEMLRRDHGGPQNAATGPSNAQADAEVAHRAQITAQTQAQAARLAAGRASTDAHASQVAASVAHNPPPKPLPPPPPPPKPSTPPKPPSKPPHPGRGQADSGQKSDPTR